MKDLGNIHYFLGIQDESHESGLFFYQAKYAEEIPHVAGMELRNPMPTLLPLQLDSVLNGDQLFSEPNYFRSLAGKLQYLTLTRPDIQFAVNYVCQRMHAPIVGDFIHLKCVLRYIRGTTKLGLNIHKNNDLSLLAFSDSDWVGCLDTRRSKTCF